jgi:sigma-54 dependent transcriptional regulator, acetoin dehydrogenase operon transcriptional activator AcoR
MEGSRPSRPRPEIELAWRRAALAGLDPGQEVRETVLSDVDRRSRLVVAAEPVLDRMARDLADTRFSVLLADSTSVIVDRRIGERSLNAALERVMAVPGSRYVESVSGTNALATAFELRHGIAVTGPEHYLEALQQFSCYGAPVIHPATRRLEGVLDVTGHVKDSTQLLAPFLMSAVRDIELQLLEGSRLAEQRMLAAFHTHAENRPFPVLVLGDDVLLANRHAVDSLHASDHAQLRELAIGAPSDPARASAADITLDAGVPARVRYRRVADSPGGVIFEIDLLHRPRRAIPRTGRPRPAEPVAGSTVLVHGEPGSGRSRLAGRLAGPQALVLTPPADRGADARDDWFTVAGRALAAGRPVVIDDAHLLEPREAGRLVRLLGRRRGPVILVSADLHEPDETRRVLMARCIDRRETLPLRQRRAEFAEIARDLLGEIPGARGRRLTPTALHILEGHDWPGNLRELSDVLAYAASRSGTGDITEADLPAAYRVSPRRRHLGPLEQAEHDTILRVLVAENGNKARTAARLGIGRNTLYQRIRQLGIPT